jgi:hypothetical protein
LCDTSAYLIYPKGYIDFLHGCHSCHALLVLYQVFTVKKSSKKHPSQQFFTGGPMNSYSRASNSSELELRRNQLEQLWQAPHAKAPQGTAAPQWLQAMGTGLVNWLIGSPSLRIWQRANLWHVQDPRTGRQHQFESEDSLRVWLEERYNA